jgi:hypothetical protein
MSDQCTPIIETTLNPAGSTFVWTSQDQRIGAVVVTGGGSSNLYVYDPPVSSDATSLGAPALDDGALPTMQSIVFCTSRDAGAESPDAGSSKTW